MQDRTKQLSILICIYFLHFMLLPQAINAQTKPLQLKPGSRIVFLGNTTMEQAQKYGVLETMLLTSFPEKKLTFRNLGWCGDTIWAESRGMFDPAQKGYARMLKQIRELSPQLIILCYGRNESFAGKAGLPDFKKQLVKLLKDLSSINSNIILLAPHRHENAGDPLPHPQQFNKHLKDYANILKQVAIDNHYYYVDLYNSLIPPATDSSRLELTTNGMHLSEKGYAKAATLIAEELGLKPITLREAAISKIKQLSVEKNALYFHHWRPQNVTYLLLFRKHEQGNNAKELPQFIPLIKQKEHAIHQLLNSR